MKRTPLKRTEFKIKPATKYMCANRCGVSALVYAGKTPVCGQNCAFEFTVKEAAKKKIAGEVGAAAIEEVSGHRRGASAGGMSHSYENYRQWCHFGVKDLTVMR